MISCSIEDKYLALGSSLVNLTVVPVKNFKVGPLIHAPLRSLSTLRNFSAKPATTDSGRSSCSTEA